MPRSTGALPATYLVPYTTALSSVRTKVTMRYHLFSFLLEGEKVVTYPTATKRITPGQFLLLPAGNCLTSEKLTGADDTYRSVLLFFSDEALTSFFTKYPDLKPGEGTAPVNYPFQVFEPDGFLTNFVQSLTLLLSAGPELSLGFQQLKLEELLLYVSQQQPAALQLLRASVHEVAENQRIRAVVEAELPVPITVEELAFLCHMSLSTFKRRFARLYGTPPNKWLTQQRLAIAAQLLRQGTLKASDVYDQAGYESMSSFIHSFKQVYGLTPKKFQMQHAS
ncbi:helix-turn-helix domain-containing protein [Hymenobacter cellulosilyticus]|uniref:AraC family transcriptional regulator n=1 Tax=Hymenobacter cellulosilyticus TaxID=2932248 RepID=A0A8T9Q646_9BACT|nr:AraC family transcriptional regulator [Hymenobacter cellulosilyticus]UOQ73116.1 AraC family transcriptional regulator [Hymenobacter cellulosilyticus]